MKEAKTHYRRVFKSDHLGVADLEDYLEDGKELIFNIREVKQEIEVKVAGKTGNFNIAYFKEDIKPLVLNSINSKRVSSFNNNSPFVEDWSNTIIELYIDSNVKFGKEVVGGVRIKSVQPKKEIVKPSITDTRFENALQAISKGTFTYDELESKFILNAAQIAAIKLHKKDGEPKN